MQELMTITSANTTNDYLRLTLDSNFVVTLVINPWVIGGIVLLIALIVLIRFYLIGRNPWRAFEIDEAEFGIGDQKVTLRPNNIDRQIAYKIWVELSTRKIGLEIDLDNDVVSEIYDSWYNFFSVTRELIKDVPVTKFRRKDTEQIIRLSIDVLNSGIRPHLTKWQARFRRWYESQLKKEENSEINPQDIQKKFPDYKELENDMMSINKHLIDYRRKMYQIISSL